MAPFIILLFLLSEAASELIEVQVQTGQDATLPCRTAYSSIDAVEWRRANPKPDVLLFYKYKQTETLHPDFKERVELVDRELKGGDASLILKAVSRQDNGIYECRVKPDDSSRKKRAIIISEPIRTIKFIRLHVIDPAGSEAEESTPGPEDEESSRVGLYIGLGALGALLGGIVTAAAVG
ncbi:coxsackievirus and adenovirus receptor-like [Sander lucioperca]|uniref:coxsackievirus and adenovirus receptor-like n=1 Tax=Sander lucioperca TaxID=283035 RepID=UPI00125DBBED|nr:coxsackievirus and adenovirus receptor-like [Sander lucioperca]